MDLSSAQLFRSWLPAFASGEVASLVLVRSKATVLDDLASGPLSLDVCPAVAISETLSSDGALVWSLSSGSAPVEVLEADPLPFPRRLHWLLASEYSRRSLC